MTPRTRSRNKDANYKVYYSKKVPQQVRFPHKKKTIRRRSTPVRDGADKRQMVFLPEKMRIQSAKSIEDSEDEDEDLEEDGGVMLDLETDEEATEQSLIRVAEGRGTKRKSDTIKEESEEAKESVRPTPKRRRQLLALKHEGRSKQSEIKCEDEHDAAPTKPEETGNRSHRLRRQSTMTQLVDGRRPSPNREEPEFKPVKRSPRLNWSGRGTKKGNDKQQRTLTQMLPGMRPLELMSDEDMEEALSDLEAQEKDSQAYKDAVAQRLAQQGLHRAEGEGSDEITINHQVEESEQWLTDMGDDEDKVQESSQSMPALVVQSVEDVVNNDDEESYQPTQYIDAPSTRTNRTLRRKNNRNREQQPVDAKLPVSRKTPVSRFSLLSTPEKRRIREIPSSQSPADSPLSTQVSPEKPIRLPLKERSGNAIRAPETPSRRKQVTFEEPPKERNPPPTLRRFQSTVQDSEEEDEDIIEEDVPSSGQRICSQRQALMSGRNSPMRSRAVGAHTQAMLEQIDQACAHADEDATWQERESSEELGVVTAARDDDEAYPELGEQSTAIQQQQILHEPASSCIAENAVKQEPLHSIEMLDLTTPDPPLLPEEQLAATLEPMDDEVELPAPAEQELHSTPPFSKSYPQDTFPSTPMVIQGDSSDEEDESGPTPPSRDRKNLSHLASTSITQPSADLDGDPVQVSRSPSAQRETQQSHSSKAEQQLQNEWLSYSQYIGTRPAQSSSMHVAPDAFSYNATPRPRRPAAAPTVQPTGHDLSQATTVDELTPKKNRRQHAISANVTPHKTASSQPFISPSKPPPLFLPSSFPSPAKTAIEGWSSPMYGRTQDFRSSQFGASLEDFSIPLPPPVEDE